MDKILNFSKNITYWVIPISAVAVLWLLSGAAWFYHIHSENTKLQIETEVTGEQIKLRLESWVNHRIEIVEYLASNLENHGVVDENQFSKKAEELLSWIPGLQALNWIDTNWTIRIVVPLEGNEPALGKNLKDHPFKSVQETLTNVQHTKQISRTQVIKLLQGGEGFATYWPILSENGNLLGYINGVFKIEQLIESCFSEPLLTERFSIVFYEEDNSVYSKDRDLASSQSELQKTFPVLFVDKYLQMKIIPTNKYIKSSEKYISYWIIGFTFLFSLWLGYILRMSALHHQILKNSEKHFRSVVEYAGYAFYLVSKEGKIIDVNQQACIDLQYTKEELTSLTLKNVDEDTNLELVLETIDSNNNTPMTFEAKHRKKDGTYIPVELRIGLIDINNEKFFLGQSRDISESKKLHELETRAQRLETAGQIAGQVAHDFNNLLAPLIAYPEFIRELLDNNHPAIEFIAKIEKSANQIAEINQQLLTLGRRGHYNLENIILNDIIKNVVEDAQLQHCSHKIKTIFEKNLLPIKGGHSQIIRVISNLIQNAYDAIDTDGTITIKTENYYLDECVHEYGHIPLGEYIKLTISDNGGGIPSEVLPTIFEPFVSTKKANKKRGSGLGLSVVDAVVKDHNGYIDVKSIEGLGTDFYLYFPITRDEMREEKSISVVGGSEKILVVDDDEMVLEVTKKILEMLGYTVITCPTGEEALGKLKKESFDLLILDMIIPNSIDGTETYKRALEIYPSQKAIIVSGYAESERVNEAIRLGVNTFIKKPFTKEIISKEIREALLKQSQQLPVC